MVTRIAGSEDSASRVKALSTGARFPARSRSWLGQSVLTCLLLSASAASAVEPAADPSALPGTVCRLTLFNDSLNLGIGVVAALFGYDKMDGNDEGYTHGMELAVERFSETGVTGVWTLGSRLYTRRQRESDDGDPDEDVPIWFTEEETLSYVADTRRRRGRSFIEYGVGALYDVKTSVALGASGQQEWFHQSVNSSNQTSYRYENDGRTAWGVFVHAGYGLQKSWPLGDSGTAVSADARVAVEPNTMTEASLLILDGTATLSRATAAMKVSATVAFEAVLHAEGIGYSPAVELAYERRGWGIRSSVAFPSGELRNHVRYNDDHDPITSLSLFFRFAK